MLPSQKHIDPHVHCRDWKQDYKATIKEVTGLARNHGVVAIFDMPNTDPPIISKYYVEERLKLAKDEGCFEGYYLYIGATNNSNQIKEAVEVATTNPKVVGIKYFTTGKGVLALTDESDQRKLYETLAECKYTGVLSVHCEKEKLFKNYRWNPQRPWSWNDARPPEAEIEAVKDQIEFATEAGFEGNLHILHVSTPGTVDIVDKARKNIRITCGATPHHLLNSTSDMRGKAGIMLKVNPPLRKKQDMFSLRQDLKNGEIDWIETDHAPHKPIEKLYFYTSGIPSLKDYSFLLQNLRDCGFSEKEISDLTYGNIKKVFTKVIE